MPFQRRLLRQDEDVLVEARPHWIQLAGAWVLATLVLAGCIAGFLEWSNAPTWFGIVLAALVALVAVRLATSVIRWRSTLLVVTTQRVILRAGVLHRVGREIPIERVQDVTYHQHFIDRLIGAGCVVIESGGDRGVEEILDVRHPEEIQNLIGQAIVMSRSRVERSSERSDDLEAEEPLDRQLSVLVDLHARGILTDDEFEEKKAEVLARM